MGTSPSQDYLRSLPPADLQAFVDALEPGVYPWNDLWLEFNERQGFYGQGPTFRYALTKAGMEKINSKTYRKP